jgi:hypothetical protein
MFAISRIGKKSTKGAISHQPSAISHQLKRRNSKGAPVFLLRSLG